MKNNCFDIKTPNPHRNGRHSAVAIIANNIGINSDSSEISNISRNRDAIEVEKRHSSNAMMLKNAKQRKKYAEYIESLFENLELDSMRVSAVGTPHSKSCK